MRMRVPALSPKMNQGLPFIAKICISIVAIVLLGSLGGIVTSQSIDTWYANLGQPAGTPPNWVFGPVWTLLYTLMGVAFALVWKRGFGDLTLTAFLTQLLLNLVWTPIFFGLHQIALALVVIILLWVAIVFTIQRFNRRSKSAALLLIPYLAWVSYATYLNAGYWVLNR